MKSNDVNSPNTQIYYKDRLFKFIFGNAEYKENALSLYNAVNGTNHSNIDDLTFTTIDDVLFLGMKNDVSFMLDSNINLYEHQSTLCPNLPVRGLMYFGRLYDSYISLNELNVYGSKQLNLPTPKFIIFYNGNRKLKRDTLRLTDSFDKPSASAIEVTAQVINIKQDGDRDILSRCRPLDEYSKLIERVTRNMYNGMERDSAVATAVDECIDDGILRDILIKHKSEVLGMFLTEYDEEKAMKLFYRDGLEDGIAQGISQGKAEEKKHAAKILAEKLNVSLAEALAMLSE